MRPPRRWCSPLGAASAQEPKLLPNERAFAFSARGIDDRTVEARFVIADGYYLYREKLRFSAEPGTLGPAILPPGKVKEDQFFGKVETYRNQLVVKLPLEAASPGRPVTVLAESQGCADLGRLLPAADTEGHADPARRGRAARYARGGVSEKDVVPAKAPTL